MNKIKKGDDVIIIAGKDKGKRGKVLAIVNDRILVEGINMVKKSIKPNPNTNEKGGIISTARPVHRSNVMVYDEIKQKGSRVGIRILKDGQRTRFLKASDQLIEVKG